MSGEEQHRGNGPRFASTSGLMDPPAMSSSEASLVPMPAWGRRGYGRFSCLGTWGSWQCFLQELDPEPYVYIYIYVHLYIYIRITYIACKCMCTFNFLHVHVVAHESTHGMIFDMHVRLQEI